MDILIVDDHRLFLDGMRLILSRLDAGANITESTCSEQAIEVLESSKHFDLILVDLNMPGMDGLAILRRLHARKVCLPIVVVSSEENIHTIKAALDSGALGFIPKTHSSQQMLSALEEVLNGEIYIPEEIEKQITRLQIRRPTKKDNDNPALLQTGITSRQHDVLQLLANGYSNKQIASTLYLTESTVKSHIRALFNCLHAENRTDCVRIATTMGLIDDLSQQNPLTDNAV